MPRELDRLGLTLELIAIDELLELLIWEDELESLDDVGTRLELELVTTELLELPS